MDGHGKGSGLPSAAMAAPPHVQHQWRNDTQAPMLRVTFNAVVSEAHEG
ncbi:MAG TPA: hypothetical protein VI542_28985 [Candidatus Tectomicrobia bacterium]